MEHHPTLSPSSFPMMDECPCFRSGAAGHAAQRGIVQHKGLEEALRSKPMTQQLEPDEVENLEYAYDVIKTICANDGAKIENVTSEFRVSLKGDDGEEVTFGTLDVAFSTVIIDYKSGRVRNYRLQMLTYALGWMQLNGFDKATVYEVYGREKYTRDYEVTFEECQKEVFDLIARVDTPDKKPRSCEYCSWCKYYSTCSEVVGQVTALAKRQSLVLPDKLAPVYASGEELATMKRVAAVIEPWAKQVNEEIKKRLIAGKTIPGSVLKEAQGSRYITKNEDIGELLEMNDADLLSVATFSMSKLTEKVAELDGLKKAAAQKIVEKKLSAIIDRKAPSVSVVEG